MPTNRPRSPLSGVKTKDENETRSLTMLHGFVRKFFEHNAAALDVIQEHVAQNGQQSQPEGEEAIGVGANPALPSDGASPQTPDAPQKAAAKTPEWPTAPIGRDKDTNIKSDLRDVCNAAFPEGKNAFCNAAKSKPGSGKRLTDLTCDD